MIKFGEIKQLNAEDVWPDEAKDFTPWVADNLQRLGEALGMDLELTRRESSDGDFCCDLLARDVDRDCAVAIETQFGPTGDDHFRKILTCIPDEKAEVVIWIAETICEWHQAAWKWWNRHTNIRFFAVEVQPLQVGETGLVINFIPVVFPNEWRQREALPRKEDYRACFQVLIDELRERRFTDMRVALPRNCHEFGSGISGIRYVASFASGGRIRANLYIDLGDQENNKMYFDRLYSQREVLERDFGEPFTWERLDDIRACRIAVYRLGSINDSPQDLAKIRAWTIEKLLKFREVFTEKVRELPPVASPHGSRGGTEGRQPAPLGEASRVRAPRA